jgi:ribose transport system permease protein
MPSPRLGVKTVILNQFRWFALAIAIAVPATLNPSFRSYDNFQSFLQSTGVLLIVSMGQSFVLLIAGIDLSVGAVLAMSSVVLAILLQQGCPLTIAVICTLAGGLAIGLLNGACTLLLRIPSFIVTFAIMGIASAVGLVVSGGDRISLPSGSVLPALATGTVLGLPGQIMLALLLLILGTLALQHLTMGRHLYAVGGNKEAARLSGISIWRANLVAFGLSGFFAAIAAVVYTARIVSGNPIGGANLNLQSIAAAVIGGVSLFGGKGTLLGACFGAILYSLIENVLNLYNVDPDVTEIVAGAIVLVAGLINVLSDSKRAAA